MTIILFLFSGLALIAGLAILIGAESALHEIEAFLLFLISAVLLSGASIVEAVSRLQPKKKSKAIKQEDLPPEFPYA